MSRGRRLGAALALVALLTVVPSRAESAARVLIACPSLPPEQRASLEARLRADVAMSKASDIELDVRCEAPVVKVEHSRSGALIASKTATLAANPSDWVEQILALCHSLLAPSSLAPSSSPVVTESERAFPTDIPAPETTTRSEPPSIVETPPATPAAAKRERTAVRAAPSPRATPSTPAAGYSLGGELGTFAELWASPQVGVVGPRAAVSLRLVPELAVQLGGAVGVGLTSPDALSTRVYAGSAEARLGRRWWLGVGAALAVISVTADNELAPDARRVSQPALTVRAGRTFAKNEHGIAVSVGLRASASSHDVRVNGESSFRVPVLAPTLTLEYRYNP